jgi:hypothetical protein
MIDTQAIPPAAHPELVEGLSFYSATAVDEGKTVLRQAQDERC